MPRLFLRVPETLGVANLIGSLLATLMLGKVLGTGFLFWPALVLGTAIHFVAWALTKLDPYWWGITVRYLCYKAYYRA